MRHALRDDLGHIARSPYYRVTVCGMRARMSVHDPRPFETLPRDEQCSKCLHRIDTDRATLGVLGPQQEEQR